MVKVIYISTNLSHHEVPLALELQKVVGKANFCYVSWSGISAVRVKLGWSDRGFRDLFSNILFYDQDPSGVRECISNSDLVVSNQRDPVILKYALDLGKVVFYNSEDWFKPKMSYLRLLYPPMIPFFLKFRHCFSHPNFHYFGISKRACETVDRIYTLKNSIRIWGYFTKPIDVDIDSRTAEADVLWVGRMLKWKNTIDLLRALSIAKSKGVYLTARIIGTGPLRHYLGQQVKILGLSEQVEFLEPLTPDGILEQMARIKCLVLTSGAGEGWGAVTNEAMSCNCLVIANNKAGSSSTLIKHGENGFLYEDRDVKHLSEMLCKLKNGELRNGEVISRAKRLIGEIWSAKNAARNMMKVYEGLSDESIAGVEECSPGSDVF
jgi:glycosyltransferase involved in cell wall biosynthesis